MEYSSRVYIKVHKNDKAELIEVLNTNELQGYFVEEELENSNYVGFIGYDLKWYNSYPSVNNVNSFIKGSDETQQCRGLIAVGENNATFEIGKTYDLGLEAVVEIYWG